MEEDSNEPSKVQLIAKSYYSRKDIQQVIYNFCKNRETIANFNNKFFAKRPDMLDYPTDIFNSVKNGATSFHCSEELWSNPLEINRDMSEEQYNEIRIGWDFLIDIDSKYLDYSKIAARVIISFLEHHNIYNIGIKFSGSKGFHLIIPFQAFPESIVYNGKEELTKNHFPDWARLVAAYIKNNTHDKITEEILKTTSNEEIEKKGKQAYEIIYTPTKEKALEKKIVKFKCPNFKCRAEVNSMTGTTKKSLRCPSCNGDLEKIDEKIVYVALSNNDNSEKHPSFFKKKFTAKELIDTVDIVLVASRHLFRAPYSLHEKTSLSSAVVEKDEIEDFLPKDADPLKVKIKNFYPNSKENEAYELLINALDHAEKNTNTSAKKKYEGKSIDIKGLTITEDMFPPIIQKIMKGIKDDGRKRALYIILSFLNSLEFPQDYIQEKIEEWNKKNRKPLKNGYVKSQIEWHSKNRILPPNYDKPIYQEFGLQPSQVPKNVKNPINYTITLALKQKGTKFRRAKKQ